MAEEKKDKLILEREYIVPLRRKFLRTPKYRRVPKAVKALKQFVARHMTIRDKDMNKIKLDMYLNEELWFRGIRKPLARVKVKCKKFESGIVKVELAEMPQALKWKKEKEEKVIGEVKKIKEVEKKKEEIKEEKKEVKEEEKEEKKKEEIEGEKSIVEAGIKDAKEKSKEVKHEVKLKREPKHKFRQALQK
jgi:large subunit ribosomal protein L31e